MELRCVCDPWMSLQYILMYISLLLQSPKMKIALAYELNRYIN